MTCDTLYRHQQALDPSALTTIAAGLHAVGAAIDDCRRAGQDVETDAAVLLLVRHLATLAGQDDAQELRGRCTRAIADIGRHPVLAVLARRGVAYDADAKALFHAEGRRAMRRLADALGLAKGSYDIRSNKGGIAVSGEVTLHGEEAWVQLGLWFAGPNRAVMFRRVRGRSDDVGDRNRFASIDELLDPARFASQLARELALVPPGAMTRNAA